MAQLHFTLDSDFFVGLFSETKDEAFGKLAVLHCCCGIIDIELIKIAV